MMDEKLGARIKQLRTRRGITEEQMAEWMGISKERYTRIEKGLVTIHLGILSKAAEIFGVTVGDITEVLEDGTMF